MTTEQTISGVPRRICHACVTYPRDAYCPVCDPTAQGKPVAWANGEQLLLCSRSPREVQPNNPMMHNLPRNIAGSALRTDYCNTPLYAEQPAPVAFPGYPPAPEDRKLPVAVVRMCDCNQGRMPCNGKCKP